MYRIRSKMSNRTVSKNIYAVNGVLCLLSEVRQLCTARHKRAPPIHFNHQLPPR